MYLNPADKVEVDTEGMEVVEAMDSEEEEQSVDMAESFLLRGRRGFWVVTTL